MAVEPEITGLETREARDRLAPGRKPHWQVLGRRCHLGYHKANDLRTWIARYLGTDGRPDDRRLGQADDLEAADGLRVLTFAQAERAAQNWFREQSIREAGLPMDDSPFNKVGPACNRI